MNRAVPIAAGLVLAASILLMACRVLFDQFDADELQHTHLAWLLSQGLLPYRDVWDHHGPVATLLNGALLSIPGARPGVDLMIALRGVGAAFSLALLTLTAALAREVTGRFRVAWLAAALLASAYFFQDRAAEIRPDPLQNVFWLAGLLVLLRHWRQPAAMLPVAAGALFGLAVLTNMKAALGPALVFLFLVAGRKWHRLDAVRVRRDLLLGLAGGVAPVAAVSAWFLAHGALDDLWRFTTLWNLAALTIDRDTTVATANIAFMVTRQTPLLLAIAVGVVLWWRSRGELHDQRQPARMLLLVVGVPLTLAWPVNDFYPQYLLACLPLLAVVAADGIDRLLSRAEAASSPRGLAAWWFAAGLSAVYLLGMAVARTPVAPHPNLVAQRNLTAVVLATTSRDTPLGVVWNTCGGYMFNRPLQFYWAAHPGVSEAGIAYSGQDPFGPPWIEALERARVSYILGRRDSDYGRLPEATRAYVASHYDYRDCLWTRRAD